MEGLTKTKDMMLIEAMKKLKIIRKRMQSNAELVQGYSAQPSCVIPKFGTLEAQAAEIEKLAQSTEDLANYYAELSSRINYTNLTTKVEIAGQTRTIHEWLQYKRILAREIQPVYMAMNDNRGRQEMIGIAVTQTDVQLVRFYDEKVKNERLRYWQDLYETVDGRLEVVNATTPLAQLPV